MIHFRLPRINAVRVVFRLLAHEFAFRLRLSIVGVLGTPQLRLVARDLRQQGYAIIKNYFDPVMLAALREASDAAVRDYGDHEQDGGYWIAKLPGVLRLRHLDERVAVMEFLSRDWFCNLVNLVVSGNWHLPSVQYTLTIGEQGGHPLVPGAAARTFGDVAHFDQWFHQLKAVIPLQPVRRENGPLLILPKSSGLHFGFLLTYWQKLYNHTTNPRYALPPNFDAADDNVPEALRQELEQRYGLTPVLAEPGDLILFDTRTLHYADQIQRGERHLLWLYY